MSISFPAAKSCILANGRVAIAEEKSDAYSGGWYHCLPFFLMRSAQSRTKGAHADTILWRLIFSLHAALVKCTILCSFGFITSMLLTFLLLRAFLSAIPLPATALLRCKSTTSLIFALLSHSLTCELQRHDNHHQRRLIVLMKWA